MRCYPKKGFIQPFSFSLFTMAQNGRLFKARPFLPLKSFKSFKTFTFFFAKIEPPPAQQGRAFPKKD
jgi:hypothetical protein